MMSTSLPIIARSSGRCSVSESTRFRIRTAFIRAPGRFHYVRHRRERPLLAPPPAQRIEYSPSVRSGGARRDMAKSFYIIDGHAHIYRAYYAPFRELNSPTGEPTKATFVFTQMLLNLVAQRNQSRCLRRRTGSYTFFRSSQRLNA